MSRKWSTLVLLLLVAPVLALAQNTGKISGRVLDATTNEPLPGANVVLDGTQLGTITDVEGNYFIIGVPVGTYDVKASYVGYQAVTQASVEINAGYTRELNFTLAPGVELTEVVVEYERPLIQKDAVGSTRVVTADEITNLPVRGVASVAALQSGVVATEGSSDLFIRGGRSEEVAYYVDGAKVVGALSVPQQSIQEQEMLMSTIPARYGDAMSGVISITTKGGVNNKFFGTIEGLTSEYLDNAGYNLGSVSIGGPLLKNKAGFFVSAELNDIADSDPYAVPIYQLNDATYAQFLDSPQVLPAVNGAGESVFIPLPGDIAEGTTFSQLNDLLIERGLLPEGTELTSEVPTFAMNSIAGNNMVKKSSKYAPLRRMSLNGNVTLAPAKSVNLRLGGAYENSQEDTFNFERSLYNRDRYYNVDRNTVRGYANWRQYVSNNTFFEIGASYSDYQGWQYPNGFSKNVEDAMFYGDMDGRIITDEDTTFTPAYDVNAPVRNYWRWVPTAGNVAGHYESAYEDGSFPSAAGIYGLFAAPGSMVARYIKFRTQQLRFTANATTQVGIHQIEFGGEYEQRTRRMFDIVSAGPLAAYFSDGSQENDDFGVVDSWADVPFKPLENQLNSGEWYGYNYNGTRETNSDNIEDFSRFYNGDTEGLSADYLNTKPHQPIYMAGYIQDKIEFRDLVINLGVRVDMFDNNTLVLKDPYAAFPIYRAVDVRGDFNVPSVIGDDFAVYFPDGNPSNAPFGYRDLEGHFYDAQGQRAEFKDIGRDATVADKDTAFMSVLKDYKPQVSFMPRIGVSFPVTDRALFFASYNVLTQRPTEEAFVAPQTYAALSNEYIANPNLRPEKTTQYELGFRQRLGSNAAIQLSGFYRTQNNKIQIRSLPSAYPVHNSYFNVDFTTTKGGTIEFDLRRTNNLSMNVNYTLQFAQGTGSDANTMSDIAWRGDYFPEFISATSFDRRHTFNVRADYRFGEGEGPEILGTHLLENFGVNIVGQVLSGMPYTQLQTPLTYPSNQDVTDKPQGGLNEAYMPWSSLVNMNIDRSFNVGGASVTAFLQIQNLLDTDNILGVFRGSGLPNDDGFLSSESGRAAIGNSGNPDSYAWHYQTFVSNPLGPVQSDFTGTRAFGLPRSTRLGFRLNF